jgi:hypothetical protein
MGSRHVRSVVVWLLAGGVGLVLSLAGPVDAARVKAAVEIGDVGTLSADGQTATVQVTASCARGWQVLEALVTVSQPQTFGMAGIPLSCTGRSQTSAVAVQSLDAPFQPGDAQVSAYVLIERRDRTMQAQDTEVVVLQP